MSVEKVSEWNAAFDGTLEGLQTAVEQTRDAGAPGECEATIHGGGSNWTLVARYYYAGDGGEDEVPAPDPVVGAGAH